MSYLASLLRWRGKRSSRRGTPVPEFDRLEPRALLSTTMSPDGVVTVTGTESADALAVRLNAGGNDLQVVGDGPGIFGFSLSGVTAVHVQGLGGDDTLTVDAGAGLVGRGDLAFPITFDGGVGKDGLVLAGAPAAGGVSETITFGPAADGGTAVSKSGATTQAVEFSGVESLLDTATVDSLTVRVNDGANLVEIAGGASSGGVATGVVRAFDVTPCPDHTAVAPAAAAAVTVVPSPAPPVEASAQAPAASSSVLPQTKAERARARAEAKRRAKELKAAAKAARKALKAGLANPAGASAALTAAPAVAPAAEELVIGRTYVPLQFANKAAVTVDTAGGDDWAAVNNAAAAAGLKSLAVNAGDGSDHVAAVATPPGVAWAQLNGEAVATTLGFIGVTECSNAPVPEPTPEPTPNPNPNPDPTPVPGNTGGGDDDNDDDGADDEKEKKPKKHKKPKKDKHHKGGDGKGGKGHGEDEGEDDKGREEKYKEEKKGKGKKKRRR